MHGPMHLFLFSDPSGTFKNLPFSDENMIQHQNNRNNPWTVSQKIQIVRFRLMLFSVQDCLTVWCNSVILYNGIVRFYHSAIPVSLDKISAVVSSSQPLVKLNSDKHIKYNVEYIPYLTWSKLKKNYLPKFKYKTWKVSSGHGCPRFQLT
jgi:hypothetical protein